MDVRLATAAVSSTTIRSDSTPYARPFYGTDFVNSPGQWTASETLADVFAELRRMRHRTRRALRSRLSLRAEAPDAREL